MSTARRLRDLLAPLGVYRWEGTAQWAELQAAGDALDRAAADLAKTQREMHLQTAQDRGITGVTARLPQTPAAGENLRPALAALLRMGGHTLADMNDAVQACGIPARVEETGDPLKLTVAFAPGDRTEDQLATAKALVEEILPCHVKIMYKSEEVT